jgi:hypothetical protein
MKTANCLKPLSGYVLATWEGQRDTSTLCTVISVAKDEDELKVGDLIEAVGKGYDYINTPIIGGIFRLKKADIIGVYCSADDLKKMFDAFDIEE